MSLALFDLLCLAAYPASWLGVSFIVHLKEENFLQEDKGWKRSFARGLLKSSLGPANATKIGWAGLLVMEGGKALWDGSQASAQFFEV